MDMVSAPPFRKSYEQQVKDSMMATVSVGNYLAYPFMMCAATAFSFLVSQEQGCGSFLGVFINSGSCNVLKNLLVLNSWAAMGEGIILSDLGICFSALGVFLGSGLYLYDKFSKKIGAHEALERTIVFDKDDLEVPLLGGENKKPLVLKSTSRIDRINEISWYAVVENKTAMILAGLVGSVIWYHVTRQILDQYGCYRVRFMDLFWFAHLSGRLEGKCNPGNTYWGMTGCAYGLAFSIVAGLSTWWWSVTSQLFLGKSLSLVLSSYFSYFKFLGRIPGVTTFSYFIYRILGLKLLSREANREFFLSIELGIKLVGILFMVAFLPLAIYEGVLFGDSVLHQFNCGDLSVVKIVTSDTYDMTLMICMWGLQLLGIDAAPTDTEVYNILPGVLLAGLVGSMLGLFIHIIKMGGDVHKIGSSIAILDDIYKKAGIVSLMFIPVSTWGIYSCAIPKYNQVMQLDSDCQGLTFPTSLWGFLGTSCSGSTVFAAIASYVSTKWIIFSNSGAIFFSLGVDARLLQLTYQYCAGSKSTLFQLPNKKHEQSVEDGQGFRKDFTV